MHHVLCSNRLEIGHCDRRVVETTVFDQLLAIPSHNPLGGSMTVRVEHGRGAEQRDIGGVEVAGVQDA